MPHYVGESRLRDMLLQELQAVAPSVIGLRLSCARGPFRNGNWYVEKIDVLAIDYGQARDKADELEDARAWAMVPDGHALDGGGARHWSL